MTGDLAAGASLLHVSGQPIHESTGRAIDFTNVAIPPHHDTAAWLELARSLRGQFAIISIQQGSAVAVTDLAGSWPVFLLRDAAGGVAKIATSLAELEPYSTRKVQPGAIYQYVAFASMDLGGETIYSDVERVPGGSVAFCLPDRYRAVEYPDWNAIAHGSRDCVECAAAALEQLIRTHVAANAAKDTNKDAKLGILLSGGTDSTLLAALLRPDFPGKLDCFTQDFRFRRYSEYPRARENAVALGLQTESVILGRAGHLAAVRALNSREQDQPCATVQAFNLWSIVDRVRGRCSAFMVGEHADSLFLGFGHFFHGLPRPFNEYLSATSVMNSTEKMQWILPKPALTPDQAELLSALGYRKQDYLDWFEAFARKKAARFEPFADRHLTLLQQLDGQIDGGLSWQRILLPVMRSLPQARLLSPFFDGAVISLALGLGVRLKYQDGKTKFLLRDMLHGYLGRDMPKAPAAASPAAIWRLMPSLAERNAVSPTLRGYYDRLTRRNLLSGGRAVNHQMKVAALGIWMHGRAL